MTIADKVASTQSFLAAKLQKVGMLDARDGAEMDAILNRDVRSIEAGMPIFEQGERPEAIEVIVDGWAIRERMAADGRRQIVGILCAGDICDFNVFMMRQADSGCRAVGTIRVARITRAALNWINQHHPMIGQALWWESMAMSAVQREWVAILASRRAEPRIAAVLCVLFARMSLAGAATEAAMPWPFTQSDLANACGLTPEHCNRTLATLRKRGLVEIRDAEAVFADPRALAQYASFDPSCLHCEAGSLPAFELASRASRENVRLLNLA